MKLVAFLALGGALWANDNWAEFRGPSGTGHSDSKDLPREWSETQNVVWKTPIHDLGWSSPVVWGKQVWVTTATRTGKEYFAICVDRETGKTILDKKIFECENPSDRIKFNSFASPTPVIEEGRVYVHFGSYGTACLATDTGEVLWKRTDLPCDHWRSPGSSPILYKDLLIVHFDGYDHQYVVAFNKKTGKTVWKTDRAHDYKTTDGDLKKAFSTPIVIELNGKAQLISPAAKATLAYDPLSGKELWRFCYDQHSAASRPLWSRGLLYISTGFGKADLIAIRPDGQGDVTNTNLAWKATKGIGSKPSPVLVDDLIYSVSDNGGGVVCIDAKTGAEVWKSRVGGKAHSASPLFADGAIYFFGEDGVTSILQPGREYKEIGKGTLESNGRVMGTPAIAGKSIFYRSETHLYRIEKR